MMHFNNISMHDGYLNNTLFVDILHRKHIKWKEEEEKKRRRRRKLNDVKTLEIYYCINIYYITYYVFKCGLIAYYTNLLRFLKMIIKILFEYNFKFTISKFLLSTVH